MFYSFFRFIKRHLTEQVLYDRERRHTADDADDPTAEELKTLEFDIRGNWIVSGSDVEQLPGGKRVQGHVIIQDCQKLWELPRDLLVAGDLILRNCPRVRTLPASLRVFGSVFIHDCQNFARLARGPRIAGDLLISGCGALNEMEDGFVVHGNLSFENCPSLEALPEYPKARRDLKFVRCGALRRLPQWEWCRSLELTDCPLLRALPEQLDVWKDLVVRRCGSLAEFPRIFRVHNDVIAEDCPELRGLPAGLQIRGSLTLSDYAAALQWPAQLDVWNLVTLQGRGTLPHASPVSLPGSLDLSASTGVRVLPDSLRVGHVLNLSGCKLLKNLPRRLRCGFLNLSNCSALRELPEGMEVGAAIELTGTDIRVPSGSLRGVQLLWGGVPIDARVAFHPEALTVDEILKTRNIALRRVMIERFGMERFMTQAPARLLDSDSAGGIERKLLRVELEGDEPLLCLQFDWPESGVLYILRVPPQMESCGQAATWLASLSKSEEYKPVV